MKKLLLLVMLLISGKMLAQNPICVSVTDTPCDANWTQNSIVNIAGNEINGLWIYYDAGSASNKVEWEIYLDTSLQYSGAACGCGTLDYPQFFTDNSHEIIVKMKVKECPSNSCQGATSCKVKVYSPKDGNTCYQVCN